MDSEKYIMLSILCIFVFAIFVVVTSVKKIVKKHDELNERLNEIYDTATSIEQRLLEIDNQMYYLTYNKRNGGINGN